MTIGQQLEACRPTLADIDADWSPSARATLRDGICATERSLAGPIDRQLVVGARRPNPRYGRRLVGIAAAGIVAAGGAVAASAIHPSGSDSSGHSGHGAPVRTVRLAGLEVLAGGQVTVPSWALPTGCVSGTAGISPESGRPVPMALVNPRGRHDCALLSVVSTSSRPFGEHRVDVRGEPPIYVKSSRTTRTASWAFGGAHPEWWNVSISATNRESVLVELALSMRKNGMVPRR